jgi:hypothetical protein
MSRMFFICLFSLIAITSAGADGLSPKELADARKLYVAKCTKCHKLYDPAKYGDAEWNGWMVKMSKKAKLKTEQSELLARYIETLRKIAGTNAPSGVIK